MRPVFCAMALCIVSACPSPSTPVKAIDPPPAETTQPPSRTIAPAVRALFTTAIGEWVIALNGNSEAVQRPTLPAELAQPISTALADLFAAVERAARAPVGDDVDGKALSRKAATVNQALAAHGIPFVIDTIVLPSDRAAATIVVFAFEVEKRRTLVVGDRAVPIAWVRRADNINLRYVVSGFTSEARRPLILLDSIDTLLTTLLGSESRTAAAARVAAVDVAGEPGGQLLDLLAARPRPCRAVEPSPRRARHHVSRARRANCQRRMEKERRGIC